MASVKRSFGWIQNPASFKTLKKVVGIFHENSTSRKELSEYRLPMIKLNGLIADHDYDSFIKLLSGGAAKLPYNLLKGRGNGKGLRSAALCSGIVQACIDGQKSFEYKGLDGNSVVLKKLYSDDWTSDGFLRWAVSLGLLEYSYQDDTCSISDLGRKLIATSDSSKEEYKVLAQSLMSYPPVIRVLSLLADGSRLTKFEIGSQLGFKAELGFTSISQDYVIALWNEAENGKERSDVRSNIEGDSDKYARMICSWLAKMKWVDSVSEKREGNFYGNKGEMELRTFFITAKGLKELNASRGNSSNSRIPKVVMYEMLATKAPNSGYLRYRRASLINWLSKPRTIQELVDLFAGTGQTEMAQTILDDIEGLRRIGLELPQTPDGRFVLKDKIERMHIPAFVESKEDITDVKDMVRQNLRNVNHDYLILIDLAYSDAANKAKKNLDAKNFEIYTAALLTKEISFEGEWLGGANKPDVVVWKGNRGYILDNKSYKDGFSIGRSNEDEIVRYIDQAQKMEEGFPANNWWMCFKSNGVSILHYLFVTSFLKGSYMTNLGSIHQRSGVNGGAVSVVNLLCFAEHVKRGFLTEDSLHEYLKNKEVLFPELT